MYQYNTDEINTIQLKITKIYRRDIACLGTGVQGTNHTKNFAMAVQTYMLGRGITLLLVMLIKHMY